MKRGDSVKQEDFGKLFESFEVVKRDKSSLLFADHMEAIGALFPAFAVRLLPNEGSLRDHIAGCQESAQYYLNRILCGAKKRYLLYTINRLLMSK